jgi:hypothetical protein
MQMGVAMGDFHFPSVARSIFVFLEVEDGTALSKYYWQSWAAEIMSFSMEDLSGTNVFPFLPCILCGFEQDPVSGKFVPSVGDVQDCLSKLLIRDGKSYKQCHGFWARTADPIIAPTDLPVIDNTLFDDFSQQFDSGHVTVPVLFWQFASPDENDLTISGLHLSVSNDSIDVTSCALRHFGWDASADLPTKFGFDTNQPTIATPAIVSPPAPKAIAATSNQVDCIKTAVLASPWANSLAEGGDVTFVGRYYKQNENVNDKQRLSAAEIEALSKAGLGIISIFQANNRNIGGTSFENGWGNAGVNYFSNGYDVGVLDGYDACTIANNWHPFCPGVEQRDRTVIYFGVDYDPEFPYTKNAGVYTSNVNSATVEKRMKDLEEYVKGLAAGFQQFHDEGGTRYFDIGLYGVYHVLERIYPLGIVSHFWQLLTGPQPDLFPHANMVQTDLPDYDQDHPENSIIPRVCTLETDFDISWGAEGSWNGNVEFINP